MARPKPAVSGAWWLDYACGACGQAQRVPLTRSHSHYARKSLCWSCYVTDRRPAAAATVETLYEQRCPDCGQVHVWLRLAGIPDADPATLAPPVPPRKCPEAPAPAAAPPARVARGEEVAAPARSRVRPTAAELEAALRRHPRIERPALRDDGEHVRLPPMAEIFDDLCNAHGGYPPTQQEFVDRCRAACASDYPEYLHPHRWPGIEARLRRAHPSFVRERHLAALLVEAGVACARSAALDIEHATDLLIAHGAYAIRLATFVATPNGWAQWERKQRGLPPDAIFVGMPLEAEHRQRVGSYWLYTAEHVRALLGQLPSFVSSGPGIYRLNMSRGEAR